MLPRPYTQQRRMPKLSCGLAALLLAIVSPCAAQVTPYADYPPIDAPYYRVRYEASSAEGKLAFPVAYTMWLPTQAGALRGVIVHQHGCGTGSCRSGRTGCFDLHWQALAREHNCALVSPTYEQPEGADCQLWCDPRNGSDEAFTRGLTDLAELSGRPELADVPWALWGHSGGGHWAGGMAILHPEKVVAAWLRSGVPLLQPQPERPSIRPHIATEALRSVPLMCNLGTQEGVTVKDGRFARVWPSTEAFFQELRRQGGLVGVAVDPLTAHECGNQRYLAIPWLHYCLQQRLPAESADSLRAMPVSGAWLAPPTGTTAVPGGSFVGDPLSAAWLPNEELARKWMQYVRDTMVEDTTPPPAPHHPRIHAQVLKWQSTADLESGLARFVIERDGQPWKTLPESPNHRFGRPIFQGLQYSDTPLEPLVPMELSLPEDGSSHAYRIFAENSVGLRSEAVEISSK